MTSVGEKIGFIGRKLNKALHLVVPRRQSIAIAVSHLQHLDNPIQGPIPISVQYTVLCDIALGSESQIHDCSHSVVFSSSVVSRFQNVSQ